MYDVCSYVLQPSTYFHRCSFVELLSTDDSPKRPSWFLSHWWGEAYRSLLTCIEQHAHDRQLPSPATKYWLCATALNQSELTAQLLGDPGRSAFVRALRLAGGIISVCNAANNRSTYGLRLWANYEVCTALEVGRERVRAASKLGKGGPVTAGQSSREERISSRERKERISKERISSRPSTRSSEVRELHETMLYDVYTFDHLSKKATGLTDGMVAVDKGKVIAQSHRQRSFSTSVLHAMYSTRVQDGRVTLSTDKTHILNAVCGQSDLECEPEVNHERYHELNKLLIKRVFHMALDSALSQGVDERALILKVLKRSSVDELTISFMQDEAPAPYVSEHLLTDLMHSLPESLTSLAIVYPLPSLPLELSSYTHLAKIRTLDFSASKLLVSLPEWLSEMKWLDNLILQHCVSFQHLPSTLPWIWNKYKNMMIDLTGCTKYFLGVHARGPARHSLGSTGKHGAHKDLLAAAGVTVQPGFTHFREDAQLTIVRELMKRAEKDQASDQLIVYDGNGQPFDSCHSLQFADQ